LLLVDEFADFNKTSNQNIDEENNPNLHSEEQNV